MLIAHTSSQVLTPKNILIHARCTNPSCTIHSQRKQTSQDKWANHSVQQDLNLKQMTSKMVKHVDHFVEQTRKRTFDHAHLIWKKGCYNHALENFRRNNEITKYATSKKIRLRSSKCNHDADKLKLMQT